MIEYIIAPAAITDLEDISDYLAADHVAAGENFLIQFDEKCRFLTEFPRMGRRYPNIRPDLRGLPLNGYIIFYRVTTTRLEIMRVIRGNRNLPVVFDRE